MVVVRPHSTVYFCVLLLLVVTKQITNNKMNKSAGIFFMSNNETLFIANLLNGFYK